MLCLESGPRLKYRQSVIAGTLIATGVAQYCLLDNYLSRFIGANPEVGLFVVRGLLAVLSVCTCGLIYFGTQSYHLARQMQRQADLTHKLRHQSEYDEVSGLKNRNAFARYAQLSEKGNLPAAVFICDIDGLKMINDTLGHVAGDIIIRETAKILRRSLPETAGIFRLGGDEFVVVLPAWPDERLKVFYERIKAEIEVYNCRQPAIPLSVSVGYAVSSEPQIALSDVFRQADCNMYQEKRAYRAAQQSVLP